MIRGTAIVLMMLTGLTLGQMPCCVLGSDVRLPESSGKQIADSRGSGAHGCPCCAKPEPPAKKEQPLGNKAQECQCPGLVAVFAGGAAPELTIEALPSFVSLPGSTLVPLVRAATRIATQAPPHLGVALTLPLLL